MMTGLEGVKYLNRRAVMDVFIDGGFQNPIRSIWFFRACQLGRRVFRDPLFTLPVSDRFHPSNAGLSFPRRISPLCVQKVRPHTPAGVTLKSWEKNDIYQIPLLSCSLLLSPSLRGYGLIFGLSLCRRRSGLRSSPI